ncbi:MULTISPECIES: PAS domain-containing protein [Kordiimonas]|jgi:hypothetical protein|uniref:PAS domain-containing protein n=1 Tax=Kordiimonas lacus TaxID=637679 RepID=A0A1G7DBS2_9PROT|nr:MULTISPECIES: PAS domain-containing protein [Kordiimonas]SDE48376.1 PAS domain-containing protein [Kordiimonas lacus]
MFVPPGEFSPFLTAWENLPRKHHPLLPHKKDISPVRFGEFLHLVCISEFIGQRQMEIRFAGTEFERLAGFGTELKNYYDMLPEKFVKPTETFHRLIRTTPCGAFVGDVITATSGARYLHETLHLPLVDDAGDARYLMVYGVGRKPYGDQTPRSAGNHNESNIKELHYLDLGEGAPTAHVSDFRFHAG